MCSPSMCDVRGPKCNSQHCQKAKTKNNLGGLPPNLMSRVQLGCTWWKTGTYFKSAHMGGTPVPTHKHTG